MSQPLQSWVSPAKGAPLVLVHGVLRQGKCFTPLIPALGARWQIHALDLRGHGASPDGDRYRVIDYVADVVRYLREAVGRPAILYGHSLGSMVAAGVAAQEPQLVSAVVLEDPPFHTMGNRIGATPLLDYFQAIQPFASSREPVPALARRLAELEVLAADMTSRVKLGSLRSKTALLFFAHCLREVRPAVLQPIVEGRWLDGYDLESVFQAIRCPALLFQCDGTLGGMLIDDDAVRLETLAADCTRIFLKGVGHQAHWTHPVDIVRHTLEFLLSTEQHLNL